MKEEAWILHGFFPAQENRCVCVGRYFETAGEAWMPKGHGADMHDRVKHVPAVFCKTMQHTESIVRSNQSMLIVCAVCLFICIDNVDMQIF